MNLNAPPFGISYLAYTICAVRQLSSQTGRTGKNNFHNFNIFKDNNRVMFVNGNGDQCESLYYALDVSVSRYAFEALLRRGRD